jgi:hypothetical protein
LISHVDDFDLLEVLTDLDSVEGLTQVDLEKIKSEFGFIYAEPKGEHKKEYTINGLKFKLLINPKDITAAQYIDLQTYTKDPIKNLPQIFAVMLIPKGGKYNDGSYDFEELVKSVGEKISIEDAYSFFLFYKKLYVVLQKYSRDCLLKQMKYQIKKEKNPEKKEQLIKIQEQIASIVDEDDSILLNK